MTTPQSGILAELTPVARHISFELFAGADPDDAIEALSELEWGDEAVIGFGPSLLQRLGVEVEGWRPFPALSASGIDIPSTPAALWLWLRSDDTGELVHRTRRWQELLGGAFQTTGLLDAFVHGSGRDLTGYEDGTENPTGDKALQAATVQGRGPGVDGSSFVAVQTWVHDFDAFEAHSLEERDHLIGRRLSDNEEIDDAPPSAHVKRTAQEDFEPEAFVVRRSIPWTNGEESGLVFVSFGRSTDAFEAQLRRMVGLDDGVTDGLFAFTRPITGAYFWCPPVHEGRLDLRLLG